MKTNQYFPDPKTRNGKQSPTNQEQGTIVAEDTSAPDLKGERPAPSSQDAGKQQQGADDGTVDKGDITGKQVDDYFGDSGDNAANDQLN